MSEYVTAEAPCGCKWYAAGPPFRCVTHRYIDIAAGWEPFAAMPDRKEGWVLLVKRPVE
ncbi:MAG TPA: hypothetical protein VFH56_12660 [Acidimicrobiales bacterium]|nr:hypothetical protein [Acidimicrobiales bacterium]